MVVSYERKHKFFHLTQSLKKLGRYVGGGKKKSIAKAAVNNVSLCPQLLRALCESARKEIRHVCSDSHDSILRLKTKPALEHFSWETIWTELQQNTPTLLDILKELIPTSKRERDIFHPALCMCASILLKLNNQKVNLIQSAISLILKAGHATKQVSEVTVHLQINVLGAILKQICFALYCRYSLGYRS